MLELKLQHARRQVAKCRRLGDPIGELHWQRYVEAIWIKIIENGSLSK